MVVLGAFAGIVFAVVPILVEQATNLVQNFPEIVQDISQQPWVQDLSKQFAGSFDIDHALQSLQSFVEKPGNLLSVGGGILAVGSGILSGVTGALIVIILMLYFLASMRGMKRAAYRFVPASRRQNFIDVSEQITQAVGRYVVGQVSQALINGILSFIFLLIIGAPLPVLLAFIAFLGSLIPLVGTLAAAIVISLLCFFASPATALFSRHLLPGLHAGRGLPDLPAHHVAGSPGARSPRRHRGGRRRHDRRRARRARGAARRGVGHHHRAEGHLPPPGTGVTSGTGAADDAVVAAFAEHVHDRDRWARSARGPLALVNAQHVDHPQPVWPVPGTWAPAVGGLTVTAEASDGVVVDGVPVDGTVLAAGDTAVVAVDRRPAGRPRRHRQR